MKKSQVAASPDAYVAALDGWRYDLVSKLRDTVRSKRALEEVIKWGHLVYFSNGPVLLIRAEEERVLFSFFRGKRLVQLEPRLKASGKYELANLNFVAGMAISKKTILLLTTEAIELNRQLGDPTKL